MHVVKEFKEEVIHGRSGVADSNLTYKGGKNGDGVYQLIINNIPPCSTFVECCAGSAAIARRIRPADDMLVIESDPAQVKVLEDSLPSHILVEKGNFMEVLIDIERARKDWFLFIDPPYLKEVRTDKSDIYNDEWELDDHLLFLFWLKNVKCNVMITHPPCQLYNEALTEWVMVDYNYSTRGGVREDRIWMNYAKPERLHDYSFLGANRTERQSNNRLTSRWQDRFAKLSQALQGKILTSLQSYYNNRL